MDKIHSLMAEYFENSDADQVAVGVIDFKKESFEACHLGFDKIFDLASLTKPFINSFNHLKHEVSDKNLELLLNHRAGLPDWARLPNNDWRKFIQSFEIKESETLYSDLSALRYMLELESKLKISLHSIIEEFSEIFFWLDRKDEYQVHDINSFNLKELTSHAGLFGTLNGVCQSLIDMNKKYEFIGKVKADIDKSTQIFHLGFDTVEDIENTLAGKGCSKFTFGHLGFTGTSFWIDAEKLKGHVILTNTTKKYWYNKNGLNQFRKAIGEIVWNT